MAPWQGNNKNVDVQYSPVVSTKSDICIGEYHTDFSNSLLSIKIITQNGHDIYRTKFYQWGFCLDKSYWSLVTATHVLNIKRTYLLGCGMCFVQVCGICTHLIFFFYTCRESSELLLSKHSECMGFQSSICARTCILRTALVQSEFQRPAVHFKLLKLLPKRLA